MSAKIIFTFRPLSLKKPMSIVNAITRTLQGYPRDHVAILYNGVVFESSFGVGVQNIDFEDWKEDRQGTDITQYTVPHEILSFVLFESLEGTKYDTRAAVFHLFGWEEKLKRRANKAINCSELVALMLGMQNAWKAYPKDVEQWLRLRGYNATNKTLM